MKKFIYLYNNYRNKIFLNIKLLYFVINYYFNREYNDSSSLLQCKLEGEVKAKIILENAIEKLKNKLENLSDR